MGIDRIGGKGAPLPAPPAGATERTDAKFELGAGAAAEVKGTAPATAPLERLRAGEIDLPTYVDLKVDEATRHLTGLRPSELESIRLELRQRMFSDPALADLVATATGTRPVPPEE